MASDSDIARFLHYISQLESSGGKNTHHKTIASGPHAGDAAQGQYGVMPNTMDELDKRYPSANIDKENPDDYAKLLANRVLDRANGDETLAAGLWNQGHNAKEERFPEIKDTEYANKYENLRKQIPYSLDPSPYYVKPDDSQDIKKNIDNSTDLDKFLSIKNLLQKG